MTPEKCTFEGCRNCAAPRGKYCWAHYKQIERRGRLAPLREYGMEPTQLIEHAALALRDADSEDDEAYRRAKHRLWYYSRYRIHRARNHDKDERQQRR